MVVAGAVEVVVLGDSDDSVGTPEVVVEVVELVAGTAEVLVVLVVVVVPAEVDVGAAVTAGSDGSSVAGCDGKPCSSAAASAASATVAAASDGVAAIVAAAADVVAELLLSLLSVEQLAASRAADIAAASRKFFVFICLDERPGTLQY